MMSRTYIATPPGATIKEQLEDRKMTQKEFAARMGMSEKHISKLINGDVHLTSDTANRLEMVLGLPSSFWTNLEADYRDKLVKARDENEMDEDIAMSRLFPYAEMANNGWIAPSKSPTQKVVNLRKFFEVSRLSLLNSSSLPQVVYRKAGESDKSFYALTAWAQMAKKEARNADVKPINIDGLKKSLPEIRSMTRQPPKTFCPALRETLASCGVALVFLPHIGGSFLHGAAFAYGEKIVLGMTVRGKYADVFWFSLMHEIGHIVSGHVWLSRETTPEEEKAADEFAKATLIPQTELDAFTKAGKFDRESVLMFAEDVGIAPGIVVGRLQKEGLLDYNRLSNLKIRYALTA